MFIMERPYLPSFLAFAKAVGCAKRSAQKRPWAGRAHWGLWHSDYQPNVELCKACRICEQVCPDCAIAIMRKDK